MATRLNPYAPLPRLTPEVFMGVTWGGVVLTGIFVVARGYARLHTFKRLFLDDCLVLSAWLMFLASSINWQIHVRWMYETELVGAGLQTPDFATFPDHFEAYLKASLASIILFYASLYFVKFSFLVFFRKLGDKVRGHNILWWVVTVITVLAWISSFATPDYHCLLSDFSTIIATCATPQSVSFDQVTLKANMGIDVITDALIMSIPIAILWTVKIKLRQKLALLGMFSLTVLTMLFAIVRVAVITSYSAQPDQLWLYAWCSVEQTIAILVACLVSFRVFFTKKDSRPGHAGSNQDGYTIQSLLRGMRSWFRSTTGNSEGSTGDLPGLPRQTYKRPHESRDSNESGINMIDFPGKQGNDRSFQTASVPYSMGSVRQEHAL